MTSLEPGLGAATDARPGLLARPAAAVRVAAAAAVAVFGAYVLLYRLGVSTWLPDEIVYADAGRSYLGGDLTANIEQPPLVKYLLGLSQTVLGPSLAAIRLPAALAGLATGGVLFAFARRLVSGEPQARGAAAGRDPADGRPGTWGVGADRGRVGWWVGLLAAFLWFLLPHGAPSVDPTTEVVKLERFAYLEVFVALLALVALHLGWRWAAEGGWRLAGLTGLVLGLAVTAKPVGILVAPVVVGFAVALRSRPGGWAGPRAHASADATARDPDRLGPGLGGWATVAREVGAAALAGILAVALVYAPFGREAPAAIGQLLSFQLDHVLTGHDVAIAGASYPRAPWWAHLYYQWRTFGPIGSVAVLAAGGAALAFAGRHVATRYLLVAVLVPFAVLSLGIGFALPHYHVLWQPALTLLVALGVAGLLARGPRWRLVGAALLVALVVVGVATTARIATARPTDYARLGGLVEDTSGDVAVWGFTTITRRYVDPERVVGIDPALERPERLAAIVVDPVFSTRFDKPALGRFLDLHGDEFVLVEVDRLDVWLRAP